LIGARANSRIHDSILAAAERVKGIEGANGLLTVHLAPDQIVAALSIEFEDGLVTSAIEECVLSLETRIRARHPEVAALFVKPQTPRNFDRAFQRRYGEESPRHAFPPPTTEGKPAANPMQELSLPCTCFRCPL
jgi:divalent metal cation (Fe/Co/Zn/Cd) transporter